MPELTLATRNRHKIDELQRLLAPLHITLTGIPQELSLPPEDGEDYAANALLKARATAAQLGGRVIADDSGIEAAALGGRPGVRSARYAGEHATDAQNLEKLIAEVPPGGRLRYVCALAFVEGPLERVFGGVCDGRMAAGARGLGGFGYDPVFVPDVDPGRTMAERSAVEKDAISHRAAAVREFARWYLAERGGSSPERDGSNR
jgi:XTP/dITP diphosphohydrolase